VLELERQGLLKFRDAVVAPSASEEVLEEEEPAREEGEEMLEHGEEMLEEGEEEEGREEKGWVALKEEGHNLPSSCVKCGRVFNNARGLQVHMATMHPGGEEDEEMDEEAPRRTAGNTTRHTAGGGVSGHGGGDGGGGGGGGSRGERIGGGGGGDIRRMTVDATRHTAGVTTRQPQPSVSGTSSVVSRDARRAAAAEAGAEATGGRTPPTPPPPARRPAPAPSRTDPAVSQPQSMTTGTSMAGLNDPRELTKGLRAWLKELKVRRCRLNR